MNKDGRYRGNDNEIIDEMTELKLKAEIADEMSDRESACRKSASKHGFADVFVTQEMCDTMKRNNDEDTRMHKGIK